MKSLLLIITPLLFTNIYAAVVSITSANTETIAGTASTETWGGVTYNFNGDSILVTDFSDGINTYAPSVEFNILNTSSVENGIKVWYQKDGTSSTSFNGSPLANNNELFDTPLRISHGSDNTFFYFKDLSFTNTTGYSIVDASADGFSIFERGGNDTITVRAVTSIDGTGTPTGFTPYVTVSSSDWGAFASVQFSIFETDGTANDGPYENLHQANSTQNVTGVIVTFDEFGLSNGEMVYGYQFGNSGGLDYIPSAAVVTVVVPEPSSTLLSIIGLSGLSLLRSRKR